MKPIIILPTYNEKSSIAKLINALFLQNITGLELVVVDDNSPDGTGDIVRELAKHFPIHLISRPQKLGLGSAYLAGFRKALELGADRIFEMDADFSHDPEDVPRLLAADADLVIGSRKIAGGKIIGWGIVRKFMSAGAMWSARLCLGLAVKDVTAGFRCFKRTVLESIDLERITSNGYAFQEELLFRTQQLGFDMVEIPVTFIDRQEGKSKLSKKDIVEFFWVMMKLWYSRWSARQAKVRTTADY